MSITIQNGTRSIKIHEVSIKTPTESIDITGLIEDIDIYENMFSDGINCRVRIKDTINLIENTPILGGETINIVFGYEKLSEKFAFSLKIVEVSDYVLSENRTFAIYSIYAISEQALKNTQIRLFRSFGTEKNKTKGSHIVKSVCNLYLGIRNPHVDETKHERYFCATGWTPHEIFEYIAKTDEPLNKKGKYPLPFIFFETREKYYFVGWDTILDGKLYNEDHEVYLNDPFIHDKQQTISYNLHNATQWKMEAFNHEENITSGIFGSRNVYFNIIHRKYNVVEPKHEDILKSSKMKRAGKIFLIDNAHKLIDKSNHYSKLFAFVGNNDYKFMEKVQEKYIGIQTAITQLFDNIKVVATFENLTSLKVGGLAFLNIPSPKMRANEKTTTWKTASGYYVVSAIRHHIDKNDGYMQSVEFIKGALDD